jgi:hypothetical protein
MERRRAKRLKRRLRVLFGEESPIHFTISLDVSATGLFLRVDRLLPIGTRVHLLLEGPGARVYQEGVVVRHVIVPAPLRQVQPQGMGIRFLRAEECVGLVVGSAASVAALASETAEVAVLGASAAAAAAPPPATARPAGMGVSIRTPAELEAFLGQQVDRGVVAVPADAAPHAPGSNVDFEVRLTYARGAVPARGEVMQVLPGGDGRPLLVVRVDPKTLAQQLRSGAAHSP